MTEVLVILDVDGTLIHRDFVGGLVGGPDPLTKKQAASRACHDNGCLCRPVFTERHVCYLRPGLVDFLTHLQQLPGVRVALWSAMTMKNLEPVVQALTAFFDEHKRPLQPFEFVWDRSECSPAPTADKPYGVLKDLSLVWSRFPFWTPKNTLLIDDTAAKASRQPENLFSVCPFTHASHCSNLDHPVSLVAVLPSLLQVLSNLLPPLSCSRLPVPTPAKAPLEALENPAGGLPAPQTLSPLSHVSPALPQHVTPVSSRISPRRCDSSTTPLLSSIISPPIGRAVPTQVSPKPLLGSRFSLRPNSSSSPSSLFSSHLVKSAHRAVAPDTTSPSVALWAKPSPLSPSPLHVPSSPSLLHVSSSPSLLHVSSSPSLSATSPRPVVPVPLFHSTASPSSLSSSAVNAPVVDLFAQLAIQQRSRPTLRPPSLRPPTPRTATTPVSRDFSPNPKNLTAGQRPPIAELEAEAQKDLNPRADLRSRTQADFAFAMARGLNKIAPGLKEDGTTSTPNCFMQQDASFSQDSVSLTFVPVATSSATNSSTGDPDTGEPKADLAIVVNGVTLQPVSGLQVEAVPVEQLEPVSVQHEPVTEQLDSSPLNFAASVTDELLKEPARTDTRPAERNPPGKRKRTGHDLERGADVLRSSTQTCLQKSHDLICRRCLQWASTQALKTRSRTRSRTSSRLAKKQFPCFNICAMNLC